MVWGKWAVLGYTEVEQGPWLRCPRRGFCKKVSPGSGMILDGGQGSFVVPFLPPVSRVLRRDRINGGDRSLMGVPVLVWRVGTSGAEGS